MQVLELTLPARDPRPLVVEVPHAGTEIPDELHAEIAVPRTALLRDADLYVDELFGDAPAHGATLLAARLSRYVVDLNRSAEDLDPTLLSDAVCAQRGPARGVIWRCTTEGKAVFKSPPTQAALSARLARFHAPYHDELVNQLLLARERFGFAILVAAHSMPSSTGRSWDARADVVPGSLGRSSAAAEVIELVDQHFRDAGLSVRHDHPYRGGFATAHYGRPSLGQHAVQIELNRALYMDEQSCAKKPGDFERLREISGALVAKLGQLSLA